MSSLPSSPSATTSQQSLPKLPKVLSIIANAANSQWQEAGKIYAAQVAMTEVSTPYCLLGDTDFIYACIYVSVRV